MACKDPESFAREGPTLTFHYYEGKEDPNITKRGPSWAIKWRFAGGPMMAQH